MPRDELEGEDVLVGHFPGLNVLDENWWFPFTQGHPFVLTITFGVQGYHVYVDGNYVCSFSYNQVGNLLQSVSAVRIGGDGHVGDGEQSLRAEEVHPHLGSLKNPFHSSR